MISNILLADKYIDGSPNYANVFRWFILTLNNSGDKESIKKVGKELSLLGNEEEGYFQFDLRVTMLNGRQSVIFSRKGQEHVVYKLGDADVSWPSIISVWQGDKND